MKLIVQFVVIGMLLAAPLIVFAEPQSPAEKQEAEKLSESYRTGYSQGYRDAYRDAYREGHKDGFKLGFEQGRTDRQASH